MPSPHRPVLVSDVWNLAADSLTLATITSHLCDCNNSRGVFLEHVLH